MVRVPCCDGKGCRQRAKLTNALGDKHLKRISLSSINVRNSEGYSTGFFVKKKKTIHSHKSDLSQKHVFCFALPHLHEVIWWWFKHSLRWFCWFINPSRRWFNSLGSSFWCCCCVTQGSACRARLLPSSRASQSESFPDWKKKKKKRNTRWPYLKICISERLSFRMMESVEQQKMSQLHVLLLEVIFLSLWSSASMDGSGQTIIVLMRM